MKHEFIRPGSLKSCGNAGLIGNTLKPNIRPKPPKIDQWPYRNVESPFALPVDFQRGLENDIKMTGNRDPISCIRPIEARQLRLGIIGGHDLIDLCKSMPDILLHYVRGWRAKWRTVFHGVTGSHCVSSQVRKLEWQHSGKTTWND